MPAISFRIQRTLYLTGLFALGQIILTAQALAGVPTLSSHTPAADATGVSASTNIVLTFSENIAAGSGYIYVDDYTSYTDSRYFDVYDPAVSISGNQLTINPGTDFTAGTQYYVYFDYGFVQSTSTYEGYASYDDFYFTVAGTLDNTAPTLSSHTPTYSATNQATNTNIVLTFDEDVEKGSGTINIDDYTTYTYNKSIDVTSNEVSISGNVVTINPSTDLTDNINYYVSFSGSGVFTDTASNEYDGSDSWDFTVGTVDSSGPSLSSHTPTYSATDQATDTNIVLTFDEDVQKGTGTISIDDYTTYTYNKSIDVTSGEVSISGNVVTINPSTDLTDNINYYVSFSGSGVFKDTSHSENAYDGADSWDFTVGTVDSSGPTLSSHSPTYSETDVDPAGNIVLTFNENVQKGTGTINIDDYTSYTDNRSIDVTSGQVSISGNVVTINPTSDLSDNINYYVSFSGSGVFKDTSHSENAYDGSDSFDFTTGTASSGTADGGSCTENSDCENNTCHAGTCVGGADSVYYISGTLYSDKGTTPVSGKTIKWAQAGSTGTYGDTTAGDGTFSLPIGNAYGGETLGAGEEFIIWVDGDANNAVAFGRANGTDGTHGSSATGIDLYYGHLNLYNKQGSGSISHTDLDAEEVSGENDISDVYSVSSNNLTMGSSTTLYVPSGDTYAPNGTIDAVNIDIDGTLNMTSAGTTTISGNFTNGGTYTPSTKTLTFDGSSQTIDGTTTIYALSKTNAGTSLTFSGGTTTVSNTLTLTGSSGNLITVGKSGSGNLVLSSGGTDNTTYVSFTGINNSGGEEIDCTTGCTDGGSNSNITFTASGSTISNVPVGRSIVLDSDGSTDVASSGQTGVKRLAFKHGANEVIEFDYDFDAVGADYDFSGITASVSGYKAVVDGLSSETGVDTTDMTLRVPKAPAHTYVRYCHGKSTLGCTESDSWSFTWSSGEGFTANEGFDTNGYSVALVDGGTFWAITGNISSGGESGGGGASVPEFHLWSLLALCAVGYYVLRQEGILQQIKA